MKKLTQKFALVLALAFAAPLAASAATIPQNPDQAQHQLSNTQAQVDQLYGPGA